MTRTLPAPSPHCATGFAPRPLAASERARDEKGAELARCLAVAGFAKMNVMLLSGPVRSGADGTTSHFLHWLSAPIAHPALAFAAGPFFRSAFSSLAEGRLNMDVPISLAIDVRDRHRPRAVAAG